MTFELRPDHNIVDLGFFFIKLIGLGLYTAV